MGNNYYVQKGRNDLYPKAVTTWRLGEQVPEWLSDQAKIVAWDNILGSAQLDLRRTSTGGYEILDASGREVVVRTKGKDDFVCKDYNGTKVLSLTPMQFKHLYSENP